jgi:hypothetical protein
MASELVQNGLHASSWDLVEKPPIQRFMKMQFNGNKEGMGKIKKNEAGRDNRQVEKLHLWVVDQAMSSPAFPIAGAQYLFRSRP